MTLVSVGNGQFLEHDTAAAFFQLRADCLAISQPYGADRTWAEQAYLHGLWRIGEGSYAAPPGQSNHEDGDAFDLYNWAKAATWLAQNAHKYGLTRDASERWHYNFTGARTAPAGLPIYATPTQNGKPMAFLAKRSINGEIGLFGADFAQANGATRGRHIFASANEYTAYKAIADTINGAGHSAGAPSLPPLESAAIVGLDETGWRTVCNVHGV
jgi:hypothetical protein